MREKAKRSWENESNTRVTIEKAIPQEYFETLEGRISATAVLCRIERIF